MGTRIMLAGTQMPEHAVHSCVERTPLAKRLLHRVVGCWSRFIAWQLRRTVHLFLLSLDERSLGAVGLNRSDIGAVVAAIDWRAARWQIDV